MFRRAVSPESTTLIHPHGLVVAIAPSPMIVRKSLPIIEAPSLLYMRVCGVGKLQINPPRGNTRSG